MALELRDWTVNENNFTTNNGCSEAADAPAGLSGATACVEVSAGDSLEAVDSASLSLTGNYTVEFWYKTSQTNGSWAIAKWATDNQSYSNYGDSLEGIQLIVDDDGTGAASGSARSSNGDIPVDGAWHHMAVTFNASTNTAIGYVDEVSKSMTNTGTPGSIFNGTAPLVINTVGTGGYVRYADVRLWNTVRSSSEIADNNNARLVGNETGLVGYWPFEDIGYPSRGLGGFIYMSV